MKKLFVLTVCLSLSISLSYAQQNLDDEVTLIQSAFGMDKKMIVDAFMDLPESVSQGFWTVYKEYEESRQELSRERIMIINEYIKEYLQVINSHYAIDAIGSR